MLVGPTSILASKGLAVHHYPSSDVSSPSFLDNMNGWNRDYHPSAAAPRDASRQNHHFQQLQPYPTSSGGNSSNGGSLNLGNPGLPLAASSSSSSSSWGGEAPTNQMVPSSSGGIYDASPSVDTIHSSSHHQSFPLYNGATSITPTHRSNNPEPINKQHQQHQQQHAYTPTPALPAPLNSSFLPSGPLQVSGGTAYPHHYHSGGNPPNPGGMGGVPLQLQDGPPFSNQMHHQQQHGQEYVYAPSAPTNHSHYHHHPHHHQSHNNSTSPPINNDYSEFRSSHMLHPFEVKHRRRTTRNQFKILEATFQENPKPNATIRKSISAQLDMPLRAVQIWFQNRRAKAKAVAKREASGQFESSHGGNGEEDEEEYNMDGGMGNSSYDLDEDKSHRYSFSPSSSLRTSTTTTVGEGPEGSIGAAAAGYHTSTSTSSDAFKMPNRPLRIDTESAHNRRMTTGTIPNPNSFTGNAFYHSPALSSSGSVGQFSSSQLSNSSASFDGNYTRPTSSSISSISSNTGAYDERYRRGNLTSPTVPQQDNMPYSNMNTYRQNQQSSQQYHHHHHHQQPQQQQQQRPPSHELQPSGLPGGNHRPVEGGNSQINYWRY